MKLKAIVASSIALVIFPLYAAGAASDPPADTHRAVQ